MHRDNHIVTPLITKSRTVTLVQIWKTFHLSRHLPTLNRNSLMETQIQQTHKPTKPKTFDLEGFKLVKPRLPPKSPQKQNSADD